MNPSEQYIIRGKLIISISMVFLVIAIVLFALENMVNVPADYTFAYQSIDIKEMGTPKVSLKKSKEENDTIFVSKLEKDSKVTNIELVNKKGSVAEVKKTQIEQMKLNYKPTWRLPTEQGYITQHPHYWHTAIDITSSRGTNEKIYPVADGVVTSIYNDMFGAKIVTVNHYINGKYYTSQYVHLSWYADGLHVGQKVTTNTVLGGMGATGIATGIHLHITVLDCDLYNPSDPNCYDLYSFFNYGRTRINQGFYGLGNLVNVPYSWYSR